MKDWLNRRAVAALFAGMLAGGVAVTGVTAHATGDGAVPAQAPVCTSLGGGHPTSDGGGITFGGYRPWAV